MLKQVLNQNASKTQAKSKQSQRQILSAHLSVLGMQVETNIISSSYVPAAASASAAPTVPGERVAMMPSTIEGIDLHAEVPCAAKQHAERHADEPASYIVRTSHSCGAAATTTLCESGWKRVCDPRRTFRCPRCGERGLSGLDWVRIVEVLR